MSLSDTQRTEILILLGCGDKTRTQKQIFKIIRINLQDKLPPIMISSLKEFEDEELSKGRLLLFASNTEYACNMFTNIRGVQTDTDSADISKKNIRSCRRYLKGTISKIEKQFRDRGHVRQLKKNPPNKLSDDQKLDVMLMLEENPHTSSRQTASALNISHSSILRVLTENQMHPYKLVPTDELAEDDFDRRILFCEQMMQMIDDNTLQIENVLFFG
ncbi:hypothetical protein NQ318_014545 [Aromia moschata]|uniref:Transposase n=1 Tax=Aromia moschata TaxID=1265417 RepID=A0AAV8XHH0_9CUCU|nr:hypothetical protein NQ318_014545 [Aromia moschata]